VAEGRAASPAGCAWVRDLLTGQQHRDRLARRLPPGVAFAGKSGSLPGLVHDCGLLTGPGGTVAVAVLTRGIPDPYAADAAIGEIGHAAALGVA
jgi:beta-lactamase class A